MLFSIVIVTALMLANSASGEAPCSERWSLYPAENKCVKAFKGPLNFHDAKEACQKEDGGLVQISDDAKNKFVGDLMKQNGSMAINYNYIGVYAQEDGTFGNADGSKLSYSPWKEGHPRAKSKNCAWIYFDHGEKSPLAPHLHWLTTSCDNIKAYTCEKSGSKKESPCPEGWSLYPAENKCVKVFKGPLKFQDAREACQKEDGDLVQISDNAKNKFVGDLMKQHGSMVIKYNYIGVYVQGDGTFGNANGSKLSYSPWKEGHPLAKTKNCAWIYFDHGEKSPLAPHLQWLTTSCDYRKAYTCEKSGPKKEIASCGEGWVLSDEDQVCLKVVNNMKKAFDEARSFCQQEGGDLAMMFNNKRQNKFVNDLLRKKTGYWIGVYDEDSDGTFTFVNGNSLTDFKPFKKGEPNNRKNKVNCIQMNRGKWMDKHCKKKRKFVCQKGLQ